MEGRSLLDLAPASPQHPAVLNTLLDLIAGIWPLIAAATTLIMSVVASIHAILTKRETSAAVGWVGVIWLAPFIGVVLYLILGINRINRRASIRQEGLPRFEASRRSVPCTPESLEQSLPPEKAHLTSLARLVSNLTSRPLLDGNSFEPLICGDEAYPEMLRAIEKAEISISLTTYIFANDETGRKFVATLARAVKRNVEVRVLIDAVGARYSFPTILRQLRRAGITYARFMPSIVPWQMAYLNLRSHRKILVVDGKTGFTGGMNIAEGNCIKENPAHAIQDLHFRVQGPVVSELQEVFAEDWAFSCGEILEGRRWFPELTPLGNVISRGITDGPDESFDRLRLTLHGALATATKSVCIATPYFLPDNSLISAMNTASMRGVEVDILIPEKNNLRFVDWACLAQIAQLLRWGCRVWRTPPPFEHTKMIVVDGFWSLIGSANWDPRSLMLNFEFNVECYDRKLALQLETILREKQDRSSQLTLADIEKRPLPYQVRDGIARLLSPYL